MSKTVEYTIKGAGHASLEDSVCVWHEGDRAFIERTGEPPTKIAGAQFPNIIAALQAVAIDIGVLDEASLTGEQLAAVSAVRGGDSAAVPIEHARSES